MSSALEPPKTPPASLGYEVVKRRTAWFIRANDDLMEPNITVSTVAIRPPLQGVPYGFVSAAVSAHALVASRTPWTSLAVPIGSVSG
jgi:hypothetical protein